MESSFREAFNMPYATISKDITCQQLLPLFSFPSSPPSIPCFIPASVSFYWDTAPDVPTCETSGESLVDYIAFQIPEWASSDVSNCVCLIRGIMDEVIDVRRGYCKQEALLLSVSDDFSCVDLSLYKERQIVMLMNERATSETNGDALLLILQADDLPFISIPNSSGVNIWKLDQLQGSVLPLPMETAKVRSIPHSVVPPLAVSSSRGVGCVFAAKKRALVYILEEDEEEEEASDMD
ncbi:hypothetical protein KSS87_007042 [Heliosperma pusillum]|nr:hypothetical protein KSS87_007042 [Heliosperma pusillum]